MKLVKSAPVAPAQARQAAIEWMIERGIEPSPENLLKEAKKKTNPLHAFFSDIPDSTWIQFGKYEAARRIIDSTKVTFEHGGKMMTVRAVEFVPMNGHGRWATTEQIAADSELRVAYMAAVSGLLDQAQSKLARMMELMG